MDIYDEAAGEGALQIKRHVTVSVSILSFEIF